ncbi:MAG TPA: sugar phosphate isomerase/epimerase [Roseiflexaceae bacterium]|nr:sugar phosphate isomerase/epimerase [Roseiflexaceae bacterium]
MHVGILTAPIKKKALREIIPWAASIGAQALEVDVTPGAGFDATKVDDAAVEEALGLLQQHGMRVSSLAAYGLLTGVPEERAAQARRTIEATIRLAGRMGVGVVCTLAGFPSPGKNKLQTIAQDLPAAMRPLLDLAGQHGVKLALENWYATNIQHLDHWRAVFEALPDAHLGLNFDPSHLDWQGIDYIGAVREFKERIFHVHAKDVSVDAARLARVGVQGEGWWRYTLPGYGRLRWGEFISALRLHGYDGVLSVEHEDAAYGPEEGFVRAVRYLNTLV